MLVTKPVFIQNTLDLVDSLQPHPIHDALSACPALLWAYGLILTMFVVIREELFGKYAAPDRAVFAMAYGGYLLVPLLVMLRVAWTPVFASATTTRKSKED